MSTEQIAAAEIAVSSETIAASEPTGILGIDNALEADLIASLLMLYPMIRIFKRAGLPRFYGFAVMVPYIGLFICFTLLTFKKWPNFIGYQQGKAKS